MIFATIIQGGNLKLYTKSKIKEYFPPLNNGRNLTSKKEQFPRKLFAEIRQVNFFNKRIQFLLIQFMINPFQWCIAMQICIPILYTKMDMGQALRGREKNKQKTEIITLKLTPSLDFNENSQIIGTITSNSVQGDKRRVQYCRYIILGQFDSQKIEVQRLKFIYSEKATKFCEIFTFDLHYIGQK